MRTLEAVVSMSTLPDEIQMDIFTKVPVKFIMISRCVCKLWYNLLCSSKFIKHHLNYADQNKNNRKLMLIDYYSLLNRIYYSIYSIDYASISSSSPSFNRLIKTDCSFADSKYNIFVRILGSCNGLICLAIYSAEKGSNWIFIFNPSTGDYKEVFVPDFYFCKNVSHGFGYDCNIDTYKLVRIGDDKETGCFEIRVYTLGSDSWSNIQSAVSYSFSGQFRSISGLLFNSALHWLGTNQQTSFEVIVSFDIRTERIVDFPLPEHSREHSEGRRWYRSVAVLGDNLCLFNVGVDYYALSFSEIWVMQEYGVKVSWTKQFSIKQTVLSLSLSSRLVCALENGEILMLTYDNYVLYEPRKKVFRSLNIQPRSRMLDKAEFYVESLVSPNSGIYKGKTY